MRKCYVSVFTVKKEESIQATGVSTCRITIQTACGGLVNLILHDVLYVHDVCRILLSVSKLSQNQFQVVMLTVQFSTHVILMVEVEVISRTVNSNHSCGNLFHVQTCADAKIKRHDRVENKWIC
jgi:hypothetical protein